MQITSRTSRQYWVTPASGVLRGILYLVTFTVGGTTRSARLGSGRLNPP
jgi:hypothetical protein